MSLASIASRAVQGVRSIPVTVEVQVAGGLPSFTIVGLPDAAVREAKERVRGALVSMGASVPAGRIIVNLAPADLPKDGGRFDLAIALGILVASGVLPPARVAPWVCVGELALDASVRPVRGVVPVALEMIEQEQGLMLAPYNAAEAKLVGCERVFALKKLSDLLAESPASTPVEPLADVALEAVLDLADVKGQARARRALEVAAAGGHHLLFSGPPGTGKTLLAERLGGIMPPMELDERRQSAAVASVAQSPIGPRIAGRRPFRRPHHTISAAALVGGGSQPRPGEVSLAHAGVLFLDELAEYPRAVLDVLREPLEAGTVLISRAAGHIRFPADVQLVAAMNPCPCGYANDPSKRCRCSVQAIERYQSRLSGPLLDRLDLRVQMPRLSAEELRQSQPGESSEAVRTRVTAARQHQYQRQQCTNAKLLGQALEQHAVLDDASWTLLERAVKTLHLSARGFDRVRRVARTLADLAGSPAIEAKHIAESLSYR